MGFKYNVFRYNLSTALQETLFIPGGFIYIKSATDSQTHVNAYLDSINNDAVNLRPQLGVVAKFERLFLRAPAQPGKWIEIIITSGYDEFRIFEQAQLADINSIATVSNPVRTEERALEDVVPQAAISVTTASTQLAAADNTGRRRSVLIVNTATTNVWIGNGTVTTATGILLLPNASIELNSQNAIHGISTAASNCRVRIERVIA